MNARFEDSKTWKEEWKAIRIEDQVPLVRCGIRKHLYVRSSQDEDLIELAKGQLRRFWSEVQGKVRDWSDSAFSAMCTKALVDGKGGEVWFLGSYWKMDVDKNTRERFEYDFCNGFPTTTTLEDLKEPKLELHFDESRLTAAEQLCMMVHNLHRDLQRPGNEVAHFDRLTRSNVMTKMVKAVEALEANQEALQELIRCKWMGRNGFRMACEMSLESKASYRHFALTLLLEKYGKHLAQVPVIAENAAELFLHDPELRRQLNGRFTNCCDHLEFFAQCYVPPDELEVLWQVIWTQWSELLLSQEGGFNCVKWMFELHELAASRPSHSRAVQMFLSKKLAQCYGLAYNSKRHRNAFKFAADMARSFPGSLMNTTEDENEKKIIHPVDLLLEIRARQDPHLQEICDNVLESIKDGTTFRQFATKLLRHAFGKFQLDKADFAELHAVPFKHRKEYLFWKIKTPGYELVEEMLQMQYWFGTPYLKTFTSNHPHLQSRVLALEEVLAFGTENEDVDEENDGDDERTPIDWIREGQIPAAVPWTGMLPHKPKLIGGLTNGGPPNPMYGRESGGGCVGMPDPSRYGRESVANGGSSVLPVAFYSPRSVRVPVTQVRSVDEPVLRVSHGTLPSQTTYFPSRATRMAVPSQLVVAMPSVSEAARGRSIVVESQVGTRARSADVAPVTWPHGWVGFFSPR